MTPAVSRETPPSAPPAAEEILGPSLEAARQYADLLATAGVERGLIGPREVSRLWERHLLNCAVVTPVVPRDCHVADVGTGAGLPGLVWALCRPDLRVTLIEPMLRRARFLEEAVDGLSLTRVSVLRARAEELHGDHRYDLVTARAVAPLQRLAEWCLPLVRPGGALVALKGESATAELAAALSTLRRLGATDAYVGTYGEDVLETPARAVVVTVESTGMTPSRHSDPDQPADQCRGPDR